MRRAQAWIGGCALLFTAAQVDAFRPVLHEYLPPDAREDIELATTTADGRLPSVLATHSGLVAAPDTRGEPNTKEPVYSQPWSRDGAANTYQADRNTGRPDTVPYTEPFTPSIAPYKRVEAFDAVGPDERLFVRNRATERVTMTGSARADDDLFYGDITVDFTSGRPVRIPSVAADARVLKVSSVPTATVTILRDGADNLFAQSSQRAARVRLLFELAAPRAAFASPGRLPSWRELGKPTVPPSVARDAARVAQAIGIHPSMSPDDVLAAMVAYFRSFTPSDERPSGQANLYLDLALSRKGVCRHRAYAFTVTALALGIPVRMVMNEAHAWVEVRQAEIWHRIDLGGAANQIAFDPATRPAHHPPPDAFPWPATAEHSSGPQVLASPSMLNPAAPSGAAAPGSGAGATGSGVGAPGSGDGVPGSGDGVPGSGAAAPGSGAAAPGSGGAAPGSGAPSKDGTASSSGVGAPSGSPRIGSITAGSSSGDRRLDGAPPTSSGTGASVGASHNVEVSTAANSPTSIVVVGDAQAQRGGPLRLRGFLSAQRSACPGARVQIALEGKSGGGARVPLGYLLADAKGEFAGTVYLPLAMQAGDYEIAATLLEGAGDDCGE